MSVDVPLWDEWVWAPIIINYHHGTLTFQDLWTQHNEHRMFFPRLVMLTLDSFGFWSQRRECLVSVVVVAATAWLLWTIARQTMRLRSALVVTAICTFFLFSPAQCENQLWGFQTAWYMVNAAVFAAGIAVAQTQSRRAALLATGLCGTLAAFSSGFGLAILPAVAAGLYLRRQTFGFAALAIWVLVSAALAGLYAWGWETAPPAGEVHLSFVGGLVPRAIFITIVAGLPLGIAGGIVESALAGVAVLSFTAFLLAALARETDPQRCRAGAPWAVVLVYGLAATMLIGYGRAGLGFEEALASRYVTCSQMLWIGCIGLAGVRLSNGSGLPKWKLARVAAASCTAVLTACLVGTWLWGTSTLADLADLARSSNDVVDNYWFESDSDISHVYPKPEFLRLEAPELVRLRQLPGIRPQKDQNIDSGQVRAADE